MTNEILMSSDQADCSDPDSGNENEYIEVAGALDQHAVISSAQLSEHVSLRDFAEKCMGYYKEHNGWAERFWNFLRRYFPSFMDAPKGQVFKAKRDIARSCRTIADIDRVLNKAELLPQSSSGEVASSFAADAVPDHEHVSDNHQGKLKLLMTLIVKKFQVKFEDVIKSTKLYKRWLNNTTDEKVVKLLKIRANDLMGQGFIESIIAPKNVKGHPYKSSTYAEHLLNKSMSSVMGESNADNEGVSDAMNVT